MNFTPLRAACCMRIAVIAWSVGISESGVEARRNDTLKVPELLPVEHLGVQVDIELAHDALDVADGQVRVPAVVEVDRQRTEAELPDHVERQIRAVDTTRQADHAVVRLALPGCLDTTDEPVETFVALGVGAHEQLDLLVVTGAVVAASLIVELDRRIAGVHHAPRTHPVRDRGRRHAGTPNARSSSSWLGKLIKTAR